MLGRDADAQDAVQEIFIRVFEQLPRYDGGREFRPWIYTLAMNSLRNSRRGEARRAERERVAASNRSAPPENSGDELERAEREQAVEREFEALESNDRQVIALHYYCGLSQREIARVLDLPKSTIQSRVERALGRLRSKLERGGLAVLIPGLERTLHQTPPVPVPEALSQTLLSIAQSTVPLVPVGGAVTLTATGGLVMSQKILIAVAVVTAIGIGFVGGRQTSSRADASPAGGRELAAGESDGEAAEARAELVQALSRAEDRERKLEVALGRSEEQLAEALARIEKLERDEEEEALLAESGVVDFEKFGKLFGENFAILARMAIDHDRGVTNEERASAMATQREFIALVGALTSKSDSPLYDPELSPQLFETLFTAGLELTEAERAAVQRVAAEVLRDATVDFSPHDATGIERLANRTGMVEEIGLRIADQVPAAANEEFGRRHQLIKEMTEGRRGEIEIGRESSNLPANFRHRAVEEWTTLYQLDDHQKARATELADDLLKKYTDLIDERIQQDPKYTGDTFADRTEFMEIQIAAERELYRLLSDEQRLESLEREAVFLLLGKGGHISESRSSGHGL